MFCARTRTTDRGAKNGCCALFRSCCMLLPCMLVLYAPVTDVVPSSRSRFVVLFCRFVVTCTCLSVLYRTVQYISFLLVCYCIVNVPSLLPLVVRVLCQFSFVMLSDFSFFVVVYRYNVNTSLHHRHMLPSFNFCFVSQ